MDCWIRWSHKAENRWQLMKNDLVKKNKSTETQRVYPPLLSPFLRHSSPSPSFFFHYFAGFKIESLLDDIYSRTLYFSNLTSLAFFFFLLIIKVSILKKYNNNIIKNLKLAFLIKGKHGNSRYYLHYYLWLYQILPTSSYSWRDFNCFHSFTHWRGVLQ